MFSGFKRNQGHTPPAMQADEAAPTGLIASFPRGAPGSIIKTLATARWPADDELTAKLDRWRPGQFLLGRDQHGRFYGHSDDRHILTVAGSRAGKGVSLIVPNLLYWPGSCLAIDPKGELATLTASRRSAAGSEWSQPMDPKRGRAFVLDPFNRVTGPAEQFRAAFNPLADLDHDTERGIDLSWQIADALVIQSSGDGSYWTAGARSFLRGIILFVAASELPDSKNLVRVRELITAGKEEFGAMLERMRAMGGIIGSTANAMHSRPPHEQMSIISTCETHTVFIEGPSMARVLGGSDFRLEDMKADRVTVYLCLPATRLSTHGRWLRLIVSLAIEAMERTGPLPAGKPPVLFCLDEFAALGHMESIESAAGQIAGYGVKLWPIVQDVTQLQRDYKEAWETFMGNAGLLTFWGNTDLTTTEHISKRLGDTELIRNVESMTETWANQSGGNRPDLWAALSSLGSGSTSASSTQSGGRSYNQQVVRGPLMNPDEIARHFARDAGNILAAISRSDLPPFALYRCAYHSRPDRSGADAAMFGGLYDPMPGQALPHTKAADRVDRDTAELWHVPVKKDKSCPPP